MKYRSLIATLVVGAIGLFACWDSASLNVPDLSDVSTGSDAGQDAPVDVGQPPPPPPPPDTCPAPRAVCGGACVDVASDLLNCGSCSNDCTTKPPPFAASCTGSVVTFPAPPVCLGGTCQFAQGTFDCSTLHEVCLNGNCGACVAGYQDKDGDAVCAPDCTTAALNCNGQGACSDATGTAKCLCNPGFSSATCATNIDECAPAPCQHGGTCTDGIASYTCQCVGGFSGTNCEVPPAGPIVFVSSSVTKGGFGSLAAADTICQNLANARGLPGTFMALVSDSTATATARLGRPAGSYKLVTGTVVATTANDLFGQALLAAIDRDEGGALLSGAEVWTGSNGDGTSSGSNCTDWTDATSAGTGTEGLTQFADGRALSSYDQFCDRDGRLYCVQQ